MIKKISALLLVLALVAVTCGCAKQEEEITEETEITEEPEITPTVVGGWTVPEEMTALEISEDALAVFEDATGDLLGNELEPLALLGTQVVAGTNYCFLCKSTLVTAEPVVSFQIAVIYEDLTGNTELLGLSDFLVSDYTTEEDAPAAEQLAGGWTVNEDLDGAVLPENVQTAFDKAAGNLLGVGYEPVAYLGSQVVAGSNYALLCKATTVTAEPVTYLTVAVIYADLQDGAEFTSFHYIDLGDYIL